MSLRWLLTGAGDKALPHKLYSFRLRIVINGDRPSHQAPPLNPEHPVQPDCSTGSRDSLGFGVSSSVSG
ncbi:MAG: hypothetical protein ACI9MC_003281 [Kiritimatiellia bacterium]|jgi:hypothetical protein